MPKSDETRTELFEGHTPEPWHLIQTPEGQWEAVEPDNLCRIIARGHGTDAEGAANGRLVRAAPALLRERDEARRERDELCQTLRAQRDRAEAALEEARRERDALAQALEALYSCFGPDGNTLHLLPASSQFQPVEDAKDAISIMDAVRAALTKAERGAP